MAGRKPKLTEELVNNLCRYVENGASYKDACIAVGIGETAFYRWLDDADSDDEKIKYKDLKVKLRDSLKKANAKFKSYHLANITRLSNGDWKASAWILERKYPKEFAQVGRNAVVLNTDNGMLPQILKVLGEDGIDKSNDNENKDE